MARSITFADIYAKALEIKAEKKRKAKFKKLAPWWLKWINN